MDTKQHPDFRLSSDSAALVKSLEHIAVGATITYAALSSVIGRDVTKFRGTLETARRAVQRDNNMVFDVVRGVGMIRLNDSEIVDLSDKARAHFRRHSKRTSKKLICVNYSALPKDKQTKHNAALSMFGILSELTTSASQKRLEEKVELAGTQLPYARAAMDALGAVI
ncbi:hypothetical protein [Propionivibrio sp.]|uniref:hypothetical protein n=1 Tax=Propionivibrio sp. TaxID=2212460 RepID=UPI003BF2DBE5